jgi:hypothetical protein
MRGVRADGSFFQGITYGEDLRTKAAAFIADVKELTRKDYQDVDAAIVDINRVAASLEGL